MDMGKKNDILKDDRSGLMLGFQKILYSTTHEQALVAYEDLCRLSEKYPCFQKYISEHWKTRNVWCLAWRDACFRGHHTNNFSEVSVRIFKDVVLSRVKAYNVVALVDFCSTILEEYYCHKFRQFANSRNATSRLFLKSILKNVTYLKPEDIISNGDEFFVPSENKTELYVVNAKIGSCSCPNGLYGKFCKHQCAIYKYFEVVTQNFPPVTSKDRYNVAFLALGDKTPAPSFYQPCYPSADFQESETSRTNRFELFEAEIQGAATSNNPIQSETSIRNPVLKSETAKEASLENQKGNLEEILSLIQQHDLNFSSSCSGINRLKQRLQRIKSPGQWETFLHTAGCAVPLRRRERAAIHVQPTSIARRSAHVTRGSKRLPAGRPPTSDSSVNRGKRKRNLHANIIACQPNAKSHGKNH